MKRLTSPVVLEALESRQLLSAAIFASGAVLHVRGDSADQRLVIFTPGPDPTLRSVSFDANGDGDFTDPGEWDSVQLDLTKFRIDMKGGADRVEVVGQFGGDFNVDLGEGDDTFWYVMGQEQSLLSGQVARLNVRGEGGHDFFRVEPQGVEQGATFVGRFDAGAGDDEFELEQSFVLAGNVVLNVDMGKGDDGAIIEQALANDAFELQSTASVLYRVSTGAGRDSLSFQNSNFAQGPQLYAGHLKVIMDGGAGPDAFYTNLTSMQFDGGDVSLAMRGGSGDDNLQAYGDVAASSTSGRLRIVLDGDAGDDGFNAFLNDFSGGSVDAKLVVDGGSGDNEAILGGTMARDVRRVVLV